MNGGLKFLCKVCYRNLFVVSVKSSMNFYVPLFLSTIKLSWSNAIFLFLPISPSENIKYVLI